MSLLVVLTRPTPSYFSFVLTVINNFKWLVAVLEKWIGQNPHVNARWGCLKRQVAWDFLCFPFLDGGIYTNKFTWSEAIDYLVFGKRELALTTKNVGGGGSGMDLIWYTPALPGLNMPNKSTGGSWSKTKQLSWWVPNRAKMSAHEFASRKQWLIRTWPICDTNRLSN